MEDLKQYKQAWRDQQCTDNQIDTSTLTKMIHRKSSSIVKWIFYVSLIEFSIFILLDVFTSKDWSEIKATGMYTYTIISFVLFYAVIIFFIFLFYKNYKSISVTNNTKGLIKSILKTRQSVKYYITTNIVMLAVGTVTAAYISFQDPEYIEIMENLTENKGVDGQLIAWGIVIVLVLLAIGVLLLIYKLIYGILIRKLNENYKELLD